MNVFDSQFEVLTLNHLNYGLFTIVNNIWTWVAVLTAAVSLWRIKAVTSSSIPLNSDQFCGPNPRSLDGSSSFPVVSSLSVSQPDERTNDDEIASSTLEPPTTSCHSTKGKFVVYFRGDDSENESGDGDFDGGGDEVDGDIGRRSGREWFEGWEKMMRLRMGTGEVGWYDCQDLRVINGNVVRLWDGDCKRRNAIAGGVAAW